VEEAKKASRSRQAANDYMSGTQPTQKAAADKYGVSQQAVQREVKNTTKTTVTKQRVVSPPQPTMKLAKDPALTAKNIKAKMGEEYAARLKGELVAPRLLPLPPPPPPLYRRVVVGSGLPW
jgi:hypothetical protein